MGFAISVVGFIGVFLVSLFLDISGAVRRVITTRIVVKGSQRYVPFAVNQTMLRLIILGEWMVRFWM